MRSCHKLHFLWVTTNTLKASDREKPMPVKNVRVHAIIFKNLITVLAKFIFLWVN